MARIKVGLYHIAVRHDPPRTVREVLEAVTALPNDASRARVLSENEPFRPRRLDLQQDHCIGEFTRIQAVNQLPLSNAAGREGTIQFAPGEPTPCDHAVFLFDCLSNVLHIDEHPHGATHSGFARYIQAVGELNAVTASPIIGLDAMLKFQRQQTFSKITVSLAGMDHADHLRNLGFNQKEILALTALFRAPKLKMELGITSRKQDPEGLARIRETVTSLLALPAKQLKKLVVEGREEGEVEDFPVDLIKGRVKYETEVELEEGRIGDAQRYRAVREAWTRNRDELRQRFSPAPNQQG
jgi:hypothetical protein